MNGTARVPFYYYYILHGRYLFKFLFLCYITKCMRSISNKWKNKYEKQKKTTAAKRSIHYHFSFYACWVKKWNQCNPTKIETTATKKKQALKILPMLNFSSVQQKFYSILNILRNYLITSNDKKLILYTKSI